MRLGEGWRDKWLMFPPALNEKKQVRKHTLEEEVMILRLSEPVRCRPVFVYGVEHFYKFSFITEPIGLYRS
jgi:hypothetical protein